MEPASAANCFICRKHRGEIQVPGGAIYEDDLVYAGHAAIPEGEAAGYLGAVLVEPRRHVPEIGDLTAEEAARIGVLLARLGRALQASEAAEHVYLFVLGHHVAHLHVWLVPRYPGTPRDYWGPRVDEWPEGPRGGPADIAALCGRLRAQLAAAQA
jgi:diadenosine tetraphosphate (Ap4A) HIT family hydrolase